MEISFAQFHAVTGLVSPLFSNQMLRKDPEGWLDAVSRLQYSFPLWLLWQIFQAQKLGFIQHR